MATNLMSVLIEQAATGRIKPANLLATVKANEPFAYGKVSAVFRKLRPGQFEVILIDEHGEDVQDASTPVEAKLMVLDHVIEAAKESMRKPAAKRAQQAQEEEQEEAEQQEEEEAPAPAPARKTARR